MCSVPLWTGALYATAPALLMNLYIVGLNQLSDVDIDRVNKPSLPLASGDLSMSSGVATVSAALFGALLLGFAHPLYSTSALRATLVGSALLGTAYSLPPLRLKRFPALAAICIMSVRGLLVNWGFVAHATTVQLRSGAAGALTSARSLAPLAFFTLFGIVIALVKDVPDVAGDARFGIRSFSVRTSPAVVLRAATTLLSLTYAAAAAILGVFALTAAVCEPTAAIAVLRRAALSVCAVFTSVSVRRRAAEVDPSDSGQVYQLYMTLWRDFYLAYFCLPFVR